MEILNLTIAHQTISCDRKRIVSNTRNVYECHFSFDDEWDGYTKTAVFRHGDTIKQIILGDDYTCSIPIETIINSGELLIGVYGTADTDKRYPTIYTAVFISFGCQDGEDPEDPTPDVYAQILSILNSKVGYAEYTGSYLYLYESSSKANQIAKLLIEGGSTTGGISEAKCKEIIESYGFAVASDYYTKSEIDATVGNINVLLTKI